MCGISGVFGRGDRETVERMLASLRHRGPDDGFIVGGVIGPIVPVPPAWPVNPGSFLKNSTPRVRTNRSTAKIPPPAPPVLSVVRATRNNP